jgi:glycerol uptake facilitator-like aquaporin
VNPAVSLGAWIRGDLSSHDVLPYIIAQFFGAIAGSIILFLLVGRGHSLGEVLLPPESPLTFFQAFIVEGALSFFFVASVLLVRDLPTKKAACVVGGVLFLVHLLALPLSGGGLNPARAIAPVVVSAEPAASALLWIFVSGPFLGGMIAGFLLRRKRVLGR